MKALRLSHALLAMAVTGACSVHKPIESPTPPIDAPAAYRGEPATTPGLPMPEMWWRDLGDRELTRLIARALSGNLPLRAAWARIDQAEAQRRGARAAGMPQIHASASASRGDAGLPGGAPLAGAHNLLTASVSASYEIDVWRRLAAGHKAAALDAQATRDDMEAIAISLAAQVADAWFDVVAMREHRAALIEQLGTSEKILALVMLRFDEGLGAAAIDVYQARQQRAQVAAQLALIDAAEAVATHRLAALLGIAPADIALADRHTLPQLPAVPGVGVPADLLLRRPDVRAMRRRVEAVDWRVAQAVAERLPRLSLSGQTSVGGASPGDLLTRPLWNLAANVFAPLFDGGRREAEVDRARGAHDELLARYGHVMLGAMVEVEDALALDRSQRAHIVELTSQIDAGRATLREARARYTEGVSDFLPVLTALDRLQRAERGLIDARRDLLAYRVGLYRALGGTWTHDLKRPNQQGGSDE